MTTAEVTAKFAHAPHPCDLDPAIYPLTQAGWHSGANGGKGAWVCPKHGMGCRVGAGQCPCYPCQAAHQLHLESLAALTRKAPRKKPRHELLDAGNARVEIEPVREHIEQILASGVTLYALSAATGVDDTTIRRARRESTTRCMKRTADRILAYSI